MFCGELRGNDVDVWIILLQWLLREDVIGTVACFVAKARSGRFTVAWFVSRSHVSGGMVWQVVEQVRPSCQFLVPFYIPAG